MIDPPPEPPEALEEPRGPEHPLQPTSAKVLTAWALGGLVVGWGFHLYADRQLTSVPMVSWRQPIALFLVAAILVVTARATQRVLSEPGRRLTPQQAVNRLVLARACAYVGALVAGAYLGYGFRYVASWLGVSSELAQQAAVRSSLAVLGGISVTVGALVLERACRVRKDRDDA